MATINSEQAPRAIRPIQMDADEVEFLEPLKIPIGQDAAIAPKEPLVIGRFRILELWEIGVYSDLAFVQAAIAYDFGNNPEVFNIDLENFIHNWRGSEDPDTGKVKKLKKRSLLNCVARLEELGILRMKSSQLSLEFE